MVIPARCGGIQPDAAGVRPKTPDTVRHTKGRYDMKKIRKVIPGIILADTLLFILLFLLAEAGLQACGMTFRKYVVFVSFLAAAAGFAAGIVQLILRLRGKMLRAVLIVLFSAAVMWSGYTAGPLLIFAFAGEEHVVRRDGAAYVAHVDAWMDTYVRYHRYVNPLVEGDAVLIEEYYGEGGFDPFRGEGEYQPSRTVYYNGGES